MTLTITDAERRTRYTPVVSTTVFAVGFPIVDLDDVEVWHDGAVVDAADYTVTGSVGTDGFRESAVVTFDTGVTGTVDIVGRRPPQRITQFTEGAGVTARELNIAENIRTAVDRELYDKLSRALVAAPGSDGAQIEAFVAGRLLIVNAAADGIEMGPDASDIAAAQGYAEDAGDAKDAALLAQAAAEDARDAALAADFATLLTTRGDLATRDGSGLARIAIGDAGQFLGTDGTDPAWATLPLIGRNTLCPHVNLLVKWASDTTVNFTADALVAFDSSGNPKVVTSVNLTFTITSTGANGREAADAEASSTWYYVWVIAKADGTKAAFGSKTASPTLPTDYLYKGLVGMVFNNGSSNFNKFVQLGEFANCERNTALSTGNASSYTSVSLATKVPPNARAVELFGVLRTSSGTGTIQLLVTPDSTVNYADRHVLLHCTPTGQSIALGEVAMVTPQTIYYQRVASGNGNADIVVTGWRY